MANITERDLDQFVKSMDRALDTIDRTLHQQAETNARLIESQAALSTKVDTVIATTKHVEEMVRGGKDPGLATKVEILERDVEEIKKSGGGAGGLFHQRTMVEKAAMGAVGTGAAAGIINLIQDILKMLQGG